MPVHPPTVQLLGATRLSRPVVAWLSEQARARVVALDPGPEDEGLPWFAPVRGRCADYGVPLGRRPADLVLDLDPDARPATGEGVLVRVCPPRGAPSADVNRALLLPGPWSLVVTDATGTLAWAERPLEPRPDDDAAALIEQATLRGVEALAEAFPRILAGEAPTPVPRPLVGGRWRATEATLVWERPAALVAQKIRACAGPWGGARASVGETVVWLQDATVVPLDGAAWAPGTVVAIDDGLTVACGRDAVRVAWLRPAWRPLRRAADWAQEVGLSPGYFVTG